MNPVPANQYGELRKSATRRRAGFTLVELIVAVTIAAMLAGAVTVTTRRMIEARNRSQVRQAAVTSIHAVTELIARDIRNLVRDPDPRQTLVRVIDGSTGSGRYQNDQLLIFCRSFRPARPRSEYSEGGGYEVQYRLEESSGDLETFWLWRRRDPVPDRFFDAGGLAVPVAGGLLSLEIEAYDGVEWLEEWDSDIEGIPHAIRVTVRGLIEETEQETWSRSTVALDRTPLPMPLELADSSLGLPADGAGTSGGLLGEQGIQSGGGLGTSPSPSTGGGGSSQNPFGRGGSGGNN